MPDMTDQYKFSLSDSADAPASDDGLYGIGGAVRLIREARGLSISKLVSDLGFDRPGMSRFERGQQDLPTAKLMAVAKRLGVPIHVLWEIAMQPVGTSAVARYVNADGEIDFDGVVMQPLRHLSRIPVLDSVSAGGFLFNRSYPDDEIVGYHDTTARVGPFAAAMIVTGDSMTNPHGAPTIPAGSRIICDPDVPPTPGAIVVATKGDDSGGIVKQLVQEGPLRYLRSLNPAYPTLELTSEYRIVATVVRAEYDFAGVS